MSVFIVRLMGGLGNQLFQYASIKGLSLKHGATLIIDDSWYNNKSQKYFYPMNICKFNIKREEKERYSSINKYIIKHKRLLKNTRNKLSNFINYFPAYIKETEFISNIKPNKIVYFDGYWQNYRYFNEYEKTIRSEFTLSKEISNENVKILKVIKSSNSVGVHIRRGIYYTDPNVKNEYFHCSLNYYKSAIEKIIEKINNPKFIIFSNDIDWVKENFCIPYDGIVVNTEGPDYEHLILMSKCKNNIIADSTFSWWGAWLNSNKNKIVIAPKNWKIDKNNLQVKIPLEWIQIEN